MVTPSHDDTFLSEALKKAEGRTSAKIGVVVRPESDSYQLYVMAFALAVGSLLAVLLWGFHVVRAFPWLLSIQLGIVVLCDVAHGKSDFLVRYIPHKILHHHAARAAMREYHELHAQQGKDKPFVLLFISQAEHYVHVVTDPVVHKRIPGGWNRITDGFTRAAPQGLHKACAEAIGQIAETLAGQFPA